MSIVVPTVVRRSLDTLYMAINYAQTLGVDGCILDGVMQYRVIRAKECEIQRTCRLGNLFCRLLQHARFPGA